MPLVRIGDQLQREELISLARACDHEERVPLTLFASAVPLGSADLEVPISRALHLV